MICDMPLPEIKKLLNTVKRKVRAHANKRQKTFVFCYAAGHGVADQ